MDLSCPAWDRSHPDQPIRRNPCSELTYLITIWLLIWFQPHPCETLPDQPDHSCLISTVSVEYFHHIIPGWNVKSALIPRKYGIRKVSETCPDLPVQVSKVKIKATDADPTPPDHRSRCGSEDRSLLPILRPDLRTDPGKQTTPRSSDN